jgi:hypothetical protein
MGFIMELKEIKSLIHHAQFHFRTRRRNETPDEYVEAREMAMLHLYRLLADKPNQQSI